MRQAVWHLFLRLLGMFDRIPAEDCVTLSPLQHYMLHSEAEWQIAYLEYCWQLDAARHYHEH